MSETATLSKADFPPELKQFAREFARRGGKAGSHLRKSLAAKRSAKLRWEKRRQRFGPSGQRLVPGKLRKKLGEGLPDTAEVERLKQVAETAHVLEIMRAKTLRDDHLVPDQMDVKEDLVTVPAVACVAPAPAATPETGEDPPPEILDAVAEAEVTVVPEPQTIPELPPTAEARQEEPPAEAKAQSWDEFMQGARLHIALDSRSRPRQEKVPDWSPWDF